MSQIHWKSAVSADFNTAADWSSGTVPGSADDAILDATGGAFTVSTSTAETVNSIQLASNATLAIGGGTTFQANSGTGSGANAGLISVANNANFLVGSTVSNSGTITVNSIGNTTRFELTATTALTGKGTLLLSDNGNNQILGGVATDKLNNSSTIAGSGALGAGQMTLANLTKGVVDATGTNSQLVLNTGSETVTNSGLIEATGSAGLLIQSTVVANTGTILAATGSVVNLQSADIEGGTLATSGTGVFQAIDHGTTLDGTAATVTNSGVFNVLNNNYVFLAGQINNTGSINLNSVGNDTRIMIDAVGATLSGAGNVVLTNNGNDSIQSNGAGATLTNVNNTISGGGYIGGGNLNIANQKAGVIDGNDATALVINSGTGLVSNAGLIEGSNGGSLWLSGATVANTGTILAATGSVVNLQSADIQGGTLATTGTGAFQVVDHGTLLDGTAASISNGGPLDVLNNNYVYIEGTIANGTAGVINMQSIGNDTRIVVTAANATVSGGSVVLSDNGGNTILGTVSGPSGSEVASTLTNDSTISGAGTVGAASLTLVNNKTIDATGANALVINVGGGNFTSSYTVTNAGLLEATNPNALASTGGLVLSGDYVANGTVGVIEANGAATHVDLKGTDIQGGTLETANGGVIETYGSDRGSLLDGTTNAVDNTGTLNVTNNAYLYFQGTIDNTGQINVESSGNDTRLRLNGNTTLTGSGPLTLTDNINNTIDAVNAGTTLTNVSSKISGGGYFGNSNNLIVVNEAGGVIDATGAAANLVIDTGTSAVVNDGLMEGTGTAGLYINYSTINDAGGGAILAANGSNVALNNSDIIGGTLETSGTGAINEISRGSLLDGATATLTISTSSTVNVQNNNYLYIQGTIDNLGTINVLSGGNDTRLRMNANTVLTGGGPIVMSDNINNSIDAATAGLSLTNVSSTISGAGNIGQGDLLLINDAAGVIDATGGSTLTLSTSSYTVANSGLIEATGAGGLLVYYSTVNDSTGGKISAATGSTVTLQSSDIIGGTVSSTGTGVVQINDRGTLLDGATAPLTLAGTFDITNNNYLYVQGVIDNKGAIDINSGGNDTRLRLNANTTLSGGGAVVMTDNGNNSIDAATSGLSLTNVSSTISGAGNLGQGDLLLINDKAGVIDGNGANTLTLQTGSFTVANSGLIEATGTGGMLIYYSTVDGSTGGTIEAGNGSAVTLQSSTIFGGTLSSTGTGTFQIDDHGSTLDGLTSTVKNAATFDVTNNQFLYIEGAIDNTGSINLESSGNDTRLRLAANTTLTGNGVIFLNGNSNNTFEGEVTGLTLTNDGNTLEGSGSLFGQNSLIFVNNKGGVVDANETAALVLSTGGNTITNAGTLEGTGSGGLVISGATIAGAGGTILAAAGSSVTLTNSTVTGGSMNTAATGQITIGNGSTATLTGITSDAGTIFVDSTGSVTSLVLSASTSLSGGGILDLSTNKNNIVKGSKTTVVLTNVDDTIEGAGKLGDVTMSLVNQSGGVINADSNVGLTISTGTRTITNAGLIEATNKGKGTIASAIVNTGTIEANGGTLTLNGPVTGSGVVRIVSGSLVIGNASAAENIAFTGTAGKLVLMQSQTFTGQVSGFSLKGKTSFDLRDVGFVSATEATFSGTASGGVLTVTDGTHTAHINLVGNYTKSTFVASSDGLGGVTVVDPTTTPNSTHAMVSAMAGFAPSSAGSSPATPASSSASLQPLVAPPAHSG